MLHSGHATVWVVSLFSTRASLSDIFLLRQQLDVIRPSWWFADNTLDTVALDTPQRLAVWVTDAPVRRTPTICPLLNSHIMSPIMLCGLQHFTAVLLLC